MGVSCKAYWLILLILTSVTGLLATPCPAQNKQQAPTHTTPAPAAKQELKLIQSAMCEKIENNRPADQAVVFSVSNGQVCCFTVFDPVSKPTVIYDRWYHGNELSTQIRLRLYPPMWATYSQIQLRDTDKGPWRVEVTDEDGRVLKVLRFSIVD